MKRRDFFMTIGGSLLAIPAVIAAAGCGGDDDGGADADNAITTFEGRTSASDPQDHSHTFTVLCADLDKNTVTYTATGGGHTHSITLDGSQLSTLAAGNVVTFDTTDGHDHSWEVRKPANAC